MFEKLIEKIEELKWQDNEGGAPQSHIDSYRCAIDDAIEIIREFEPPELDAPNEANCWWWNNALGDWRACKVDEGSGRNGNEFDYPMWADKKGSKWTRAIVPK